MKIETFKDGSRLVVVFDGLTDVTEQLIVEKFLGGIISPPAELENMPEEEPLKIYTSGPYAGKTPEEVFAECPDVKSKDAAYKVMRDAIINKELMEETQAACMTYLKERFASADPEKYPQKLTKEQQEKFILMYNPVLSSEVKEKIANDLGYETWPDMINTLPDFSGIVAEMLKIFK